MRVIIDVAILVAMIGAVIFTWYAVSYAVLLLIGKALPLVGRKR